MPVKCRPGDVAALPICPAQPLAGLREDLLHPGGEVHCMCRTYNESKTYMDPGKPGLHPIALTKVGQT